MLDEQSLLHVNVVTVHDAVSIRLRGEADLSNREQLRTALGAVPVDGRAVVHLRLGHLGFCDVGAFRQLADFAAKVREAGGEIVVHNPSHMFLRLAALLGGEDGIRVG